jgi:hypothetical protein
MQIAPIHELAVFDVATIQGRGSQTLVSLTVDGETVYSKSIIGIRTANSGTNTVGAFNDESKFSICAWIDPVSKEFLMTYDAHTLKPVMLIPGLVLLPLVLIAHYAGLMPDAPLVQIVALPVLVGALIAAIMKAIGDRKLEMAMRAVLKT